jgi:hypothetical protein
MSKNHYWIADPNSGAKALVEGVEERDRWTKVQGWSEATEPTGDERVWLYNASIDGRTVLPFDASQGHWKGIGWAPGAPPEPVDTTRDPALMDQPEPAAAPTAPSSAASPAAATTTKEK